MTFFSPTPPPAMPPLPVNADLATERAWTSEMNALQGLLASRAQSDLDAGNYEAAAHHLDHAAIVCDLLIGYALGAEKAKAAFLKARAKAIKMAGLRPEPKLSLDEIAEVLRL